MLPSPSDETEFVLRSMARELVLARESLELGIRALEFAQRALDEISQSRITAVGAHKGDEE